MNCTRNEWERCVNRTQDGWKNCGKYTLNELNVKDTPEASGEDVKKILQSSREDVKTTPKTSGEDVKKILQSSREDVKTTPKTSGEDGYKPFTF